jgi:hypothetical protein
LGGVGQKKDNVLLDFTVTLGKKAIAIMIATYECARIDTIEVFRVPYTNSP